MEDRDFVQPYEWLVTEFSRGCKFSCACVAYVQLLQHILTLFLACAARSEIVQVDSLLQYF